MDMAAGAAYSGRRALVTTKQVGMNVLSDSLFYTVYTGPEAGLVVVTADDPGMFSTQNEQDNRHYAKLGNFPLLEPADSQEARISWSAASKSANTSTRPVWSAPPCGPRIPNRGRPRGSAESQGRSRAVPPEHGKIQLHVPLVPRAASRSWSSASWIWPHFAETSPWNRIEWGERDLGIIASGVVVEYAKEVFPEASFLKLGMSLSAAQASSANSRRA